MIDTADFVLEPLPSEGFDTLASTLRDARLRHDDLIDFTKRFFCASSNGVTIGYVGLETSGADALLRSAVVFSRSRGRGYGRSMVERLLDVAREQGIERVWLLTTSAPGFFAKLNFKRTPRSTAPPAIAQSDEFRSTCPETAVCMVCELSPPAAPPD
jgi:amino-acid N-acetyltransferase